LNAAAPKRRLYSPELKNQVVAQARLPGASIAGVALSHGINANIVHRWLRERAGQPPADAIGLRGIEPGTSQRPDGTSWKKSTAKPAQDIRIELRRGATVVNIAWPVAQADECAAWMRELLR
jgi:transposase